MVFLTATALGSGIITAVALAPISYLAALVATPLVASLATVLAGAVLAYRQTAHEALLLKLDVQTDAMVASLGSAAGHAKRAASARGSEAA